MNTCSNIATKKMNTLFYGFVLAFFALAVFVPDIAYAAGSGFEDTKGSVTSFFTNIKDILEIASLAIVTIAFIFAGYQVAFAHKRLTEVAPILVGGLVIGAAGQIASMLLGK